MSRSFFVKLLFCVALMIGGRQVVFAQDLLKAKNLEQLRVDQLSDADIEKIRAQLVSNSLTIDQAETMALQKGMQPSEFAKLRQRLAKKPASTLPGVNKKNAEQDEKTGRSNNSTDSLTQEKYPDNRQPLINPLIFGSELYTSTALSFEPNLKLATPVNYILGPDDQITVSVYGVQEYNGELIVSPEGNIQIPNIGLVKVAGLTIEEATQKLKAIMGNSYYPYLKNDGAKLSVTLSKIRSIRVTVIGSNLKGDFTVSSLSTVFNALYLAGGPSQFGSFREIELIRGGKVIRKIDLYRLLLNGDMSDNVGLKDNDVIRIPPYRTRVEVQGQVKRPGIFEVLPNEEFSDVLDFASGFTDTAYKAVVKVYQRNDKERQVFDLTTVMYPTYKPQTGDVFVVSKILNRFLNRVRITGAVYRPDIYELTPNLKVADLIRKADGLTEDAFTGRGQVIRLQEDLTRSVKSFDIKKALAGAMEDNFLLQREDEVTISSVQELRDTFKVQIQGEVRFPGEYDYLVNLSIKDLILQAGGFTDAAYKNIEIARIIKRDSLTVVDTRKSEIIDIEIDGDLTSPSANITLVPFDVVTVRRKAGYQKPESIRVTGQVQYPGLYAISNRNEKVSDILRRAGGYTSEAYVRGAFLKRYKTEEEKKQSLLVASRIQKNIKDTSNALLEDIDNDFDHIPLDMDAIMKAPGSIQDLIVKENDELVIPKFNGQVKVSGSVLLATQIPFSTDNSFRDYISAAGGYSGNAWKRKAYLVYANGRAATAKRFLFFTHYPKVMPGSEVIVPKKPERKTATLGEIIGISSAIASLAGVVIAVLR